LNVVIPKSASFADRPEGPASSFELVFRSAGILPALSISLQASQTFHEYRFRRWLFHRTPAK
jgi:hypothetical protein